MRRTAGIRLARSAKLLPCPPIINTPPTREPKLNGAKVWPPGRNSKPRSEKLAGPEITPPSDSDVWTFGERIFAGRPLVAKAELVTI
jgi:hypothetical protein